MTSRLSAKPISPMELEEIQLKGDEWCEKKHGISVPGRACKDSVGFLVSELKKDPRTATGLTHMMIRQPIEKAFRHCNNFKDERFGICVDAIEHAEAATIKLMNKKALEEREEALVRIKPGMKGFTLPVPGCARPKALEDMQAGTCRAGFEQYRVTCQVGARAFGRIARESFQKRGICSSRDLAFITKAAEEECDEIHGGRGQIMACKTGVRDMAAKVKRRYFFTRFKIG